MKTTVAELGANMGRVIPTASALGVGVEQLGASYAIMTANGISTAESTTYMNSMFNELGKSGTKVDEVLKEVAGKSFKQLMESGSSVGDVLQILNDHAEASGLSLTDLFGSAEAGKAALSLLSSGADEFNGMLDTMNNSTGATDRAFNELNNTMKEKLSQSFNSFKNALADLGASLEPIILIVADLVTKFSEWVSWMAQTNPALLNTIAILGMLLAAIGPVLMIIGQMSIGIGALIKAFSLLSLAKLKDIAATAYLHLLYMKDAVLKGLSTAATIAQTAATVAWNVVCGIATTLTTALGVAIAFLTSPIGLVILAITALIAIGILLYKNWDTIKAKCSEIWENTIKPAITNVTNAIGTVIKTVWTGISSFLTGCWNGIKSACSSVWNGIKSVVQSVSTGISTVVSSVWNGISSFTSSVWNGIKTVISTVWNGISSVVKSGTTIVKSTISSVFSTLEGILTAPFRAAQRVISGILGGISSAVSKVSSAIKNVTNSFKKASSSVDVEEVPVATASYNARTREVYNDPNDYSQARFNYAAAKQTSVSDVIASNYSMLDTFKDFASNMRLEKVDTGNSTENNISVNLNIDKMINSDNRSIEQIAEELAFVIKRKTVF